MNNVKAQFNLKMIWFEKIQHLNKPEAPWLDGVTADFWSSHLLLAVANIATPEVIIKQIFSLLSLLSERQ